MLRTRTTRITFRRHIFKACGMYKCQMCERRYQRTHTSEWTENPFHKWEGRQRELDQEVKDRLVAALNNERCNRCRIANAPRVIEWTAT
jgi:hypothetical protein